MQESSDEQLTTTTSNKTNERGRERLSHMCGQQHKARRPTTTMRMQDQETAISSSRSRRSSRSRSLSCCRCHCRPLDKQSDARCSHSLSLSLSLLRPAVFGVCGEMVKIAQNSTHTHTDADFLFGVKYFNICSQNKMQRATELQQQQQQQQ